MVAAPAIRVRGARAGEGERLREIAHAAKGHWGYDAELVAGWAAGIDLSAPRLARADVYVAEAAGTVVGWCEVLPPEAGVSILEDLWVEPSSMRRGAGTALFRRAAERARELGARRLQWGADPNSVGFYEKVGGRRIGEHRSEWGRLTPLMAMDL